MSAAEPAIATDLRNPGLWMGATDMKGRPVRDAWISGCGRYAICRYPPAPLQRESYSAFRRHGPPEISRWEPPPVLSNHPTFTAAREACAFHLEATT